MFSVSVVHWSYTGVRFIILTYLLNSKVMVALKIQLKPPSKYANFISAGVEFHSYKKYVKLFLNSDDKM